jgi:hypothetical protein
MVENRTPEAVPQNPSNTYAISMKIHNTKAKVASESYGARVVIDGRSHDMVRGGGTLFNFDYQTNDLKHKAAYYFDVDYLLCGTKKTYTSRIYEFSIMNRYVVGFECNRGRPYTQISLLGRGFVGGDTVEIGGVLCDTEFISPNVLNFVVPLVEGGKSHGAILRSENGDIGLGDFFVDALDIGVDPESILLKIGDKQVLTISIGVDAPPLGLPLNITTDIPESIIMHDVTIRGGERSANVVITGGEPGAGSLFIGAPGFEESRVLVLVHMEDEGDGPRLDEDFDWSDDTSID